MPPIAAATSPEQKEPSVSLSPVATCPWMSARDSVPPSQHAFSSGEPFQRGTCASNEESRNCRIPGILPVVLFSGLTVSEWNGKAD